MEVMERLIYLYRKFSQLKVSNEEYACMKAINFLNQGKRPGGWASILARSSEGPVLLVVSWGWEEKTTNHMVPRVSWNPPEVAPITSPNSLIPGGPVTTKQNKPGISRGRLLEGLPSSHLGLAQKAKEIGSKKRSP